MDSSQLREKLIQIGRKDAIEKLGFVSPNAPLLAAEDSIGQPLPSQPVSPNAPLLAAEDSIGQSLPPSGVARPRAQPGHTWGTHPLLSTPKKLRFLVVLVKH